jgi:hypothetical protein
MQCPKCIETPGFHSFIKLGKTTKGYDIIYSKPAIVEERKLTEETMENYLIHLDNAGKNQWVWIIDSRGLDNLETPNLFLLHKFYLEIQKRYKNILKHIFILNKSYMMQIIYTMLYPFLSSEIKKMIVFCSKNESLIEHGIDIQIIKNISN